MHFYRLIVVFILKKSIIWLGYFRLKNHCYPLKMQDQYHNQSIITSILKDELTVNDFHPLGQEVKKLLEVNSSLLKYNPD